MNPTSFVLVLMLMSPEAEPVLALRGLDPVELVRGKEAGGDEKISVVRGRFRYRFSSEENRAAFEKEPRRFAIQMGGACGRMGPLSGAGSPDRFLVHDGRIYVFASDACRKGFQAAPETHIDTDDPVPPVDEAGARRGRELLQRVIAAVGGAERVDAVKSYVQVARKEEPYQGERVDTGESFTVVLPDRIRVEGWWGKGRWAHVATSGQGFFTSGDEMGPMDESQVRCLEKQWHRNVLAILRARQRPDFVAVASGTEHVGDVDVERLTVAFAGATTVLGVDPKTTRVVSAVYRGRAGAGRLGEIRSTFSDHRSVGGLVLPFTTTTSFDGKPLASGPVTLATIELDAKIDPGLFSR